SRRLARDRVARRSRCWQGSPLFRIHIPSDRSAPQEKSDRICDGRRDRRPDRQGNDAHGEIGQVLRRSPCSSAAANLPLDRFRFCPVSFSCIQKVGHFASRFGTISWTSRSVVNGPSSVKAADVGRSTSWLLPKTSSRRSRSSAVRSLGGRSSSTASSR